MWTNIMSLQRKSLCRFGVSGKYLFKAANACPSNRLVHFTKVSDVGSKNRHELCLIRNFSNANKLPDKKPIDAQGKWPISWKDLFLILGIVSLFIDSEKIIQLIDKVRRRKIGKAAIGETFDVDHDENPCSSEDFSGQWLLVYIGFTRGPDICPKEIEKMIQVVEDLDKTPQLPKVQPLFMNVDATRDNVETVAKFIKEFSPKLLELTGTKDQVHRATLAHRLHFSDGPKDRFFEIRAL